MSKVPDYNTIIIFGVKNSGKFQNCTFYTGQPASCKGECDILTKTRKKKKTKVIQNQEYLETIGISNDKLREMIQTGQNKSFGAKITGAGGGGCIFALTDESNLDQTINQFKEKNYD